MNDSFDHFEFMGLHPSASSHDIQEAIDRLSDDAARLVYTSPAESQALWERIRQIKQDLLADELANVRYLHASAGLQAAPTTTAALAMSRSALTDGSPNKSADQRSGRLAFWAGLAGIAAIGIASVGLALHGPGTAGQKHVAVPLRTPLRTVGALRGGRYTLGQQLTLRWSAVPNAMLYRVQIAKRTQDAGAATFRHIWRTVITRKPTYAFTPTAANEYSWRLQVYRGGTWTLFTTPQLFEVVPPAPIRIAATTPRHTARHSARPAHRVVRRKTHVTSRRPTHQPSHRASCAVRHSMGCTSRHVSRSTRVRAAARTKPATHRQRVKRSTPSRSVAQPYTVAARLPAVQSSARSDTRSGIKGTVSRSSSGRAGGSTGPQFAVPTRTVRTPGNRLPTPPRQPAHVPARHAQSSPPPPPTAAPHAPAVVTKPGPANNAHSPATVPPPTPVSTPQPTRTLPATTRPGPLQTAQQTEASATPVRSPVAQVPVSVPTSTPAPVVPSSGPTTPPAGGSDPGHPAHPDHPDHPDHPAHPPHPSHP